MSLVKRQTFPSGNPVVRFPGMTFKHGNHGNHFGGGLRDNPPCPCGSISPGLETLKPVEVISSTSGQAFAARCLAAGAQCRWTKHSSHPYGAYSPTDCRSGLGKMWKALRWLSCQILSQRSSTAWKETCSIQHLRSIVHGMTPPLSLIYHLLLSYEIWVPRKMTWEAIVCNNA